MTIYTVDGNERLIIDKTITSRKPMKVGDVAGVDDRPYRVVRVRGIAKDLRLEFDPFDAAVDHLTAKIRNAEAETAAVRRILDRLPGWAKWLLRKQLEGSE